MGNSESKLGFKQNVFALAGNQTPAPTSDWWSQFYTLPESAEDVFSLWAHHDLRNLTTNTPDTPLRTPSRNLETLIYTCVARLKTLQAANHDIDPNEILNCVRLLTRCLPFIYEADGLRDWEEEFFWQPRKPQEIKPGHYINGLNPAIKIAKSESDKVIDRPLGEVLIDVVIPYLFFHGLTLPTRVDASGAQVWAVSWSIWYSGIGTRKTVGMTAEHHKNATEVISLLLVLCSRQMYIPPSKCNKKAQTNRQDTRPGLQLRYSVSRSYADLQDFVADSYVPALRYITTQSDRQIILTLLCSLMNTVVRYNPRAWPITVATGDDVKERLVHLCLQFLDILIVYNGIAPGEINGFRKEIGRIHRAEDLQFVHQGISAVFANMVNGIVSYIPGTQKPAAWTPETLVFLWEMLRNNKRFKAFIIETDRVNDLVIMVLYWAVESKDVQAKHGVLRLCILILQTLSQDAEFARRLNKPIALADTLPVRLRISNFHGSYADFLILTLRGIMVTSNGRLESMYTPMLFIISDIAPYVRNLQRATSIRLLSLFSVMANANYLFEKKDNPNNLIVLLDAFTAILENAPSENPRFTEAVLRNRRLFHALRDFTVEGALDELDRQAQRRKDLASSDLSGGGLLRNASIDSLRGSITARSPSLGNVPEHVAFAIGDDEDDEESGDDSSGAPTPRAMGPSTGVGGGDVEAVASTPRNMSEKARGKQPAHPRHNHNHNTHPHSRTPSLSQPTSTNTSTTSLPALITASQLPAGAASQQFIPTRQWLESWLPYLPLHSILEFCDRNGVRRAPAGAADSAAVSIAHASSVSGAPAGMSEHPGVGRVSSPLGDRAPRPTSVVARASLPQSWYLSLLWGLIFASDAAVNKGINGIWSGTAVKLFNVESRETAITLRSPRGAVDALGNSIAQRLGNLGFGGRESGASPTMSEF